MSDGWEQWLAPRTLDELDSAAESDDERERLHEAFIRGFYVGVEAMQYEYAVPSGRTN